MWYNFFFQAVMGVFYYIHSVALIEDLNIEDHYSTPHEFYTEVDVAFKQVNATATKLIARI